MKFLTTLCLVGVAVVLLASVSEARHRHSRKNTEQSVRQIQQEEPKPVAIDPVESAEAVEGSVEKERPGRSRKAPVICTANAAAANIEKPNKVETKPAKDSFEILEPESQETFEIESSEEDDGKKNLDAKKKLDAKKVEKPSGKVVVASSEESMSDEAEPEPAKGVSMESLEEPEAPKALTNDDVSMEEVKAVESEEEKPKAVESEVEKPKAVESEVEKPKAKRAKHNRKDVRRIDRPHRRRVVFRDEDDE